MSHQLPLGASISQSARPRSMSPPRSSHSTQKTPLTVESRRAPVSPSPSSTSQTASQARRKRSLPIISLPLVSTLSSSSLTSADDSEHGVIPPVPPLPFALKATPPAAALGAKHSLARPVPTSPGDPFYLTRRGYHSSGGPDMVGGSRIRVAVPMEAAPGYAKGRRPHTAGAAPVDTPPKPDPRLNSGWSNESYGMGSEGEHVYGGEHVELSLAVEDRRLTSRKEQTRGQAGESWKAASATEGVIDRERRTVDGMRGKQLEKTPANGAVTPAELDVATQRAPSPGIPIGSFVHLIDGTLRSTGSAVDLSRSPIKYHSLPSAPPSPSINVTPHKHPTRPSTEDRRPLPNDTYTENSSPGSSSYMSAPSSPASWNPPGVSPLRTITAISTKLDKHIELHSPLYSTPTNARTGKMLSAMKYKEPTSPASPSFLMSPPPDISTYANSGKRARAKAESIGQGKAGSVRGTAQDAITSSGLPIGAGSLSAVSPRRPALGEAFRRASENNTTTIHGLGFGLGVLGSPAQMRTRRGSEGNSTMEGQDSSHPGSSRSSAVTRNPFSTQQRSQSRSPNASETDHRGPSDTPPTLPFRSTHHIHVHQPSPPTSTTAPHRPDRSVRRPSTPSGSPSIDDARHGYSPRTARDIWSTPQHHTSGQRNGRMTPLETIFSEDNLDEGGNAGQESSWQSLLNSMTRRDDEQAGSATMRDDSVPLVIQDLQGGASSQPSRYSSASPRLYYRDRIARGHQPPDEQENRLPDYRAREPFSRHASYAMPTEAARPPSASRDGDAHQRGFGDSISDHINLEYQESHNISGSPSIELKRFSRLDLAEAVSAVMDNDGDREEFSDPMALEAHRRGQMAKQLSAIQGLIADMGFGTMEGGISDKVGGGKLLSGGDDVWSSPETTSSRRRSTTEFATPRAISGAGGTRGDRSAQTGRLSTSSSTEHSPPVLSDKTASPRGHRQTLWSEQHHRCTSSSTSAHRRSASADFVATRKHFMRPISETSATPGSSQDVLFRAMAKKSSLKHRRSTSSLDRLHSGSGLTPIIPPPPRPTMQRHETFEVAAMGISSLRLDQGGTDRSAKTWRASMADEDAFDNLSQAYGKKEMRRQELIWELCETENAFLADMQLVLRRFAQPLRTPQGRWIDGIDPDVSRLFDWLEDIVQIHLGINEKFQAMQAQQAPLILEFAQAFKPCVSHLTIHLPYLVRFEGVSRKIESLVRNTESEIGEFVRMQTAAPECKSMSLASYLLKPVQRLMKYPLFFKQIRDLTPPEHVDHAATLSLLHATDAVIRVMQEVKAREEELESLRQLEGRIKGLPANFTLAHRERHLLYQGVLNRVMLSERDHIRLTVAQEPRDTFHSSTKQRTASVASRTSTSTAQSAPSPLLSPQTDMSLRPDSMFSEASTADSSFAPSTKSAESAFIEFKASTLFRRPSMASSESSYADSRRPSTSCVPSLPHELKEQDRPKFKAKEVPLYLFVFSDIVLIATQTNERSGLLGGRRGSTTKEKAFQISYKLVDSCGIGRALALKDCSGQLGYQYLVELDLLSMQPTPLAAKSKKTLPAALAPVSSPTANTVFLTLPDRSSAKMVIAPQNVVDQSYAKWLDAFRRSCIASHRTLSVSGSLTELAEPSGVDGMSRGTLDSDVISPKKGGKRVGGSGTMMSSASMYSLEEREEREWWARRYKAVKDDMAQGMMGR